jgi:hypothetical protein
MTTRKHCSKCIGIQAKGGEISQLRAPGCSGIDRFAAAEVIAALTLGCSSRYQPAKSPHVSKVMRNGALIHVRDGVVYDSGIDGGLTDAVRDNPKAKAEADAFVHDTYWGIGSFIAGLGLEIAGFAVLPHDQQKWQWDGRHTSAVCLWSAGLAAYAVGIGYLASSAPHQVDAINIYNDDVDAKLQAQFLQQLNAAKQAPQYPMAPPNPAFVPSPSAPFGSSAPVVAPAGSPGPTLPALPAPNHPEPSKTPIP